VIKNEQASLPQRRKIQGEKEVRGKIREEEGGLYLRRCRRESQEGKTAKKAIKRRRSIAPKKGQSQQG